MLITIPDLGLIQGETVVVERREKVGTDPGNNPMYDWTPEPVDNVVVSPGTRADLVESNRPDGKVVKWTLSFPKGYGKSLANCKVSVRGQESLPVVGDPQPTTESNTPGPWNLTVELEGTEG